MLLEGRSMSTGDDLKHNGISPHTVSAEVLCVHSSTKVAAKSNDLFYIYPADRNTWERYIIYGGIRTFGHNLRTRVPYENLYPSHPKLSGCQQRRKWSTSNELPTLGEKGGGGTCCRDRDATPTTALPRKHGCISWVYRGWSGAGCTLTVLLAGIKHRWYP